MELCIYKCVYTLHFIYVYIKCSNEWCVYIKSRKHQPSCAAAAGPELLSHCKCFHHQFTLTNFLNGQFQIHRPTSSKIHLKTATQKTKCYNFRVVFTSFFHFVFVEILTSFCCCFLFGTRQTHIELTKFCGTKLV